jgi:hypothetical protein
VFCSISPEWDADRAPQSGRAVTLSTHTILEPWWKLFQEDRSAYETRIAAYTERLISAGESVFPGFRSAAKLVLPHRSHSNGTPRRSEAGWAAS